MHRYPLQEDLYRVLCLLKQSVVRQVRTDAVPLDRKLFGPNHTDRCDQKSAVVDTPESDASDSADRMANSRKVHGLF